MKYIQGSGGGGKGGNRHTPVEADDSLQSIQYASVTDVISEGQISGLDDGYKSIFLNGTPVQDANGNNNFEGYSIDIRTGTQNQSYIPALAANEIERSDIGSIPLTHGNVTIKSITNTTASRARVTIQIPTLRIIEDDGDIIGHKVIIKIRVQYNGGGYTTVVQDEIKGKSSNNYLRDYVFPLTGAFPVEIEVSRVSTDDANSRQSSLTNFVGLTEIIDEKLSYPNTALAHLRFDSRQFSNIPSRKFLLRGILCQLPTNASVDTTTHIGRVTYSGIWDGTFGAATWCNDPAWLLFALLTNKRWGVGLETNTLDKFDFYTISKYCNQLVSDHKGGLEPRFALNTVLNTRKNIYDAIQQLTAIFRGMSYFGAGSVVVSQDAPADSQYIIGASNVIDGNFEYTGTSQKARHTTCTVAYQSYEKLGEVEFEYVEDVDAVSKYGVINKEIKSIGCYSQGQAHRLGLWTLKSEQFLTQTCTFSVSIDSGLILRPNMVIDIADKLKSGHRHTGRLRSGSTTTDINIDSGQNISIDITKTPTISVLLPTGILETKPIQNIDTTNKKVTVSSAFSQPPNAEGVYLMQSSEVQTQQYRIIDVTEQSQGIYAITALQYNNSIYEAVDEGEPITVRSITNLNAAPSPVTDIEDREFLYSDGQGVFVGCDLSWQHDRQRVTEFRVTYRIDNDNWATLSTSSPSISLRQGGNFGALRAGNLQVQIQAFNYLGKGSVIAPHSVPLAGKTAAPENMLNLTMIPTNGLARLQWKQSTSLDVTVGGLVRLRHSPLLSGVSWANSSSIHSDLTGNAKEAYADLKEGTYLAKFVDSGGRASVDAAYVEFTKPDLENLHNINTQTEHTNFTGNNTNLTVNAGELLLDANGSVLHTTGEYFFANNPIILANIFSIQLQSLIKVRAFFPNSITINLMGLDYDANAAPNTTGFASLASFVGDTPNNCNAQLYLRTTQLDPNDSSFVNSNWTTWRPFNNAQFKARAYELKLQLSSGGDNTAQIAIEELSVSSDMPIRTINGSATSDVTQDYVVQFANKFAANPVIGITFSASATGEYYNITNTSSDSFSVSIYNASNSRQAKAFNWTATGYGKG